ncbi:hypothetical protein AB0M47_05130 [Hamadaea sp. NPDC051192]|uniref:hypothetical protein n=1 Tax=Hamadaea sp. NPDC051192 TaxID=3154940 RepID=UPI00342639CD
MNGGEPGWAYRFVADVAALTADGDLVADDDHPGRLTEYEMENDHAWQTLYGLIHEARGLLETRDTTDGHPDAQPTTTVAGPGGQLRQLLGPDADLLAADLDVAARRYHDQAAHILSRQPDGLTTAARATQLAAAHQQSAQRCAQIAERIRTLLAPEHNGDPDGR